MLLYNIEGISININLNNGIYYMGNSSSTGKTYLAELLNEISRNDDSIFVYSHSYRHMMDINMLFNKSRKLVMLDRFDLYYSKELIEKLLSIKDNTVLLLDWKYMSRESDAELCEIYMDISRIEVFEHDVCI